MLEHLARDRDVIVTEVKSRIVDGARGLGVDRLMELVNDTLYHERERLRKHAGLYRDPSEDKAFFKAIGQGLHEQSRAGLLDILDKLAAHYALEIVGMFDPTMYKAVTMVLPSAFSVLLNTMSPFRLMTNLPSLPSFDKTLIITGETAKLRRIKDKGGVLVYAPTHLSNLDSPVIGYGIYKSGLEPVMYGAGLNLFQLPIFHLFMGRLGAYRVDRLKKAPLYKQVLKEYATVTLEMGYDHLFFPGGTRGRSGHIEASLKKGLLGTALKAFVSCRRRGKDQKYYIVPVTVSYHLVLEARTLVEDHLQEVGKSRYIIIDDESSKPLVIAKFIDQLLSLEGKVYLHFGEPLDPFGNDVDDEGRSLDRRGRILDLDGYISRDGAVVMDDQRDAVYTRDLETRIVDAYARTTTVLTTHVVAYVLFRALRAKATSTDLFKFLRDEASTLSVPFETFEASLTGTLLALRSMEARGAARLEPLLRQGQAFDVAMGALKHFGLFHDAPVIERRGNRLFTNDPNLLYYYHNKLDSLGEEVAP